MLDICWLPHKSLHSLRIFWNPSNSFNSSEQPQISLCCPKVRGPRGRVDRIRRKLSRWHSVDEAAEEEEMLEGLDPGPLTAKVFVATVTTTGGFLTGPRRIQRPAPAGQQPLPHRTFLQSPSSNKSGWVGEVLGLEKKWLVLATALGLPPPFALAPPSGGPRKALTTTTHTFAGGGGWPGAHRKLIKSSSSTPKTAVDPNHATMI